MKIKLLLMLTFSSFYAINAMRRTQLDDEMPLPRWETLPSQRTPFTSRVYEAIASLPKLDTTKKLILQEQSLYDQGSDQGKVQFPYSLSKFTDLFKGVDTFEKDLVLPISMAIDQKDLDIITKILTETNTLIRPGDSEQEIQKKVKVAATVQSHLLSIPDQINLLKIADFLGIPGLYETLRSSLRSQGWNLKDQIYKNLNTDKEELLIGDNSLYFIINKIKKDFFHFSELLNWDSEKQKIIDVQTETFDQAIFIEKLIYFLRKNSTASLRDFFKQNPNAIKIFETFPRETQHILINTKFHF